MADLEKATTAKMPYGLGDVNLLSAEGMMMILAITIGFVVFHATSAVGANVGNSVLDTAGQFLPGGNPAQSGNNDAPEGV
ncbi:hypothetical protein [Halomarina oriensis]|uniref:Uncharacterized protein n=1 Tax=Halomarina oriensis TaxID=671145 RepID=A0A6B0GTD1_9EURY|nr:hypothetical protein [Halomarina oriensis]MWG36949.1 hypothetical protein [Halomarina oriensis]